MKKENNKRIEWEEPLLVRMDGAKKRTSGTCNSGSTDAVDCITGVLAGFHCGTGNAAVTQCDLGNARV